MFWETIKQGFSYIGTPWGWGFILAAVTAHMIFSLLIRLSTTSQHMHEGAGPGCLTQVLGMLFQGLIMALLVALWLPVLLNPAGGLSGDHLMPLGFIAIRAGLLAVFVVMLLSAIPWLGRWLTSSPGLEVFLLAAITFRFMVPAFWNFQHPEGPTPPLLFLNTWESLGYVLLAFGLTRLIMVLVFSLAYRMEKSSSAEKRFPTLLRRSLGPSLDILGGILVFFMYASYVFLSASS